MAAQITGSNGVIIERTKTKDGKGFYNRVVFQKDGKYEIRNITSEEEYHPGDILREEYNAEGKIVSVNVQNFTLHKKLDNLKEAFVVCSGSKRGDDFQWTSVLRDPKTLQGQKPTDLDFSPVISWRDCERMLTTAFTNACVNTGNIPEWNYEGQQKETLKGFGKLQNDIQKDMWGDHWVDHQGVEHGNKDGIIGAKFHSALIEIVYGNKYPAPEGLAEKAYGLLGKKAEEFSNALTNSQGMPINVNSETAMKIIEGSTKKYYENVMAEKLNPLLNSCKEAFPDVLPAKEDIEDLCFG